jgi:hypothetical protein
MERIVCGERMVELENLFEEVWNRLSMVESVELETLRRKTSFVARASMATRFGSGEPEKVLLFLKDDGDGRLKECSRCYAYCWWNYMNCLGREGQRIGMYCRAIDCWVSEKALEYEID